MQYHQITSEERYAIAALRRQGLSVLVVETERGILLTPSDPEVEEALAIAGNVAGRYRNALRELAK